jgi:thiamine-monophosphate kinase
LNEADFIDLLRPLAGPEGLNLEDDAAILSPPVGQDLVLSKDTMVEGVHFPDGRIGGGFSERLLLTALSDLAAKGARPVGYMLSVAWPTGRDGLWVKGFVQGLYDAQSSYDCPLLGGDTVSTKGPMVASVTVFGVVPSGQAVLRSGATVGDDVWFTGQLGLAERGLAVVLGHDPNALSANWHEAENAYLRPKPRFEFRKALRRYATACADISDGIMIDAAHIAQASQVRIDLLSSVTSGATFGDDYELLFTASCENREALKKEAEKLRLPLTLCGKVLAGTGLSVDGFPIKPEGYQHQIK